MELSTSLVRIRARLPLKLPIWVLCRESAGHQWTEKSRLIDVNQFGAGFTLTRPVEVGRLIQVTAPLPHKLRCFDQLEPMYSVWGLVRHVSIIQQQPLTFRVGVAFIGKHAPESYQEDPTSLYEPLPIKVGQSVLWSVKQRVFTGQRRETRLVIPMEVLIEVLDDTGEPVMQEYTVTETISSLGACVPCTLDVEVGRIVRITSLTDRVAIFAAIRSRKVMPDGIARLGVEFIAERWPLQRESSFIYQNSGLNSPHQAV